MLAHAGRRNVPGKPAARLLEGYFGRAKVMDSLVPGGQPVLGGMGGTFRPQARARVSWASSPTSLGKADSRREWESYLTLT